MTQKKRNFYRLGNSKRRNEVNKKEQFKIDIKRARGVDFIELGMNVEIDGQFGEVVGINHSANLIVKFGNRVGSCHPFWKSKYFDGTAKCIAQYD